VICVIADHSRPAQAMPCALDITEIPINHLVVQ
jgi:hypothetical protein